MSFNLDPDAQHFIDSLSSAPPLYTLSVPEARNVLEKLQTTVLGPLFLPTTTAPVYIVYPTSHIAKENLPIILYFHGGGWILASFHTHQRLVQELADRSGWAIVFVEYDRAPESKWPTQIEQGYAVLNYLVNNIDEFDDEFADEFGLDTSRIVLMGDSVGGNMATAVTMLANEYSRITSGQKLSSILAQVLLYPVTDAHMDTKSYEQFKDGPWLTKKAMEWFWNAYTPSDDTDFSLTNPLVSPLHAPLELLEDMPATLIITDENDVLRDEGEAYAEKLSDAGVQVTATRYNGIMHDFLMLNALFETPQRKEAIEEVVDFLADL